MRTYRPKQTEILILEKIICNRCGKEAVATNYDASNLYHEIKIEFGYPSPNDGMTWKFDLCEECIKDIVDEFDNPVTATECDMMW